MRGVAATGIRAQGGQRLETCATEKARKGDFGKAGPPKGFPAVALEQPHLGRGGGGAGEAGHDEGGGFALRQGRGSLLVRQVFRAFERRRTGSRLREPFRRVSSGIRLPSS